MSYLEDTAEDSCPFCHRALNDYIQSEAYAGKFVSIDVPLDIPISEAVILLDEFYAICRFLNERRERGVKIDLDVILRDDLKFKHGVDA